jgi:hypothetical protein
MKNYIRVLQVSMIISGMLAVGSASATVINVAAGSLTNCPTVGSANSCALVYRFNSDGSIDTLLDSTVPSTDGIEDTLTGVINNSGHTIDSIALSGVGIGGLGVFGFDGDGQSVIANPGSGPGDTYFGQYSNAAGAILGTTYFTNISSVSVFGDTGVVNFPGLPDGGSGWWVLEDQISFTAPPTVGGTVPEPATMALLGLGLAGLGAMRRRKV